jgi:drug/metabolite transporter (DMT)-like permease
MRSGDVGGLAAALASSAMLAVTPTFVKVAYEGGVDPGTVGACRTVVMMVACAIACLWLGKLRMPRRAFRSAAVGGLVYGVGSLGFMVAIGKMDAGMSIILLYLHPPIVAGWRWFRAGTAPSWIEVASVVMSLFGVALVAGMGGHADLLGILLGIGGAIGLAAMILFQDDAQSHGATAWQSSLVVSTCMAVVMVGYVVLHGGPRFPANAAAAAALAFVSFTLVVGLVLFAWAMRKIGAFRSTMVANIEPVIGIGFPAMVLGERMTPMQMLGGVVVVAALFLLEAPRFLRKDARSPAAATE